MSLSKRYLDSLNDAAEARGECHHGNQRDKCEPCVNEAVEYLYEATLYEADGPGLDTEIWPDYAEPDFGE